MTTVAKTRGRGAVSNPQSRFAGRLREAFDDGWIVDGQARATSRN